MKLLILTLLISVNCFAQFKVEYTETSTGGTYHFQKADEAKAKEHLVKIIKKSQWMKGEWKADVSDLSKVETNLDGSETTSYYHPSNFTYTITDITQQLADEAAAKLAEKQDRQQIKAMKANINASSLPNWHKRILKKLIKDMKD